MNRVKVLAAVVGIAVAAFAGTVCNSCNNPLADGFSKGGSNKGGKFVLTDVPSEYNGKYAWLRLREIRNYRIGGFQESDTWDMLRGTFTLVKISNGRVNIPMWVLTDNAIERYTGNETVDVVIFIHNEESLTTHGIVAPPRSIAIIRFESVTFLNGNATKSYNEWRRRME